MDMEQDEIRWPDLTPQSRAARATYLIMQHRELQTRQLAEMLGYESNQGVNYLMSRISLGGVPVFQPQAGYWAILPTEG